MKTIEQTSKFISSCIFEDNDWEMVLDYCRNEYGGGKVHRPKRGLYSISFPDFVLWHKHMPGHGEIVMYGDLIGIIGKCTPHQYHLHAYIGKDGQFIQKELVVYPHRLERACQEDESMFKKLMADLGLCYSVKLGMIVNTYIPCNGEFILVRHGKNIKHAIFDRIELSSYVFYYIDNSDDKVESVSIPFSECEIEKLPMRENITMLTKFSQLGVMWDPRRKVFTKVPLKAELGGKYWYVNDKFYVCQAKDMQTPVHKERYKNGNYFTSYAEALVFVDRLKDLRMELNKGYDF